MIVTRVPALVWSARILLVTWMLATTGRAAPVPPRQDSLHDLPGFQLGRYRIGPYLRAAVALQSLGRAAASEKLLAAAQEPKAGEKLIPLCRMLFAPRARVEFRPPGIGEAFFLGGTKSSDWPLAPITLVNGVPILIVRGYLLEGEPETGDSYVRFCLANCEWNSFRFSIQTAKEQLEAITALLQKAPWKKRLQAGDHQFFYSQIE